ncbi:MAG: trimeric intracellular cation channel family protein [Bacteroidetes bacterium]|nr:trimeric intracellular cation channel family protein [Bacteroidota bacterium]
MFYWLEITGTVVFAISGVMAAAEKRLDIFGALVIAFVTALGGGTIRDLLLNKYPIFWMDQSLYLWLILGSTIAVFFFVRNLQPVYHYFLIPDAVGLGLFTLIGIQKAELLGAVPSVCVIMGVITAAGGGIIRDLLLGTTPAIFHNREIYATACFLGAGVYFSLQKTDLSPEWISLLTIGAITLIRLASLYFGWRMPRLKKVTRDSG